MTQHPLDAESRQWGSDTQLKLIRLAETLEPVQCTRRRARYEWRETNAIKPRIASSAALLTQDASCGGCQNEQLMRVATRIFSPVLAAISCPGRLENTSSSAAWAAHSHTISVRRQAYGSGAVGLTSKDFLDDATSLTCNLNKSCATQVLARESLSLSYCFCILSCCRLRLAQMQILSNSAGYHCEALLWMNLQNWAGAGTFKPSSPIHVASAKASAHLADSETNPCHLQGLLPAWSKLNDLVRLRAAIITSCIPGARKI